MENNQLLPIPQKKGLFVVSVPKDASQFTYNQTDGSNKPSIPYIKYVSGKDDLSDVYFINLPKGKWKILGTYSPKEGFSFDPALIVESFTVADGQGSDTFYLNYRGNNFVYKLSKESALSLLSVNGWYFVNPMGEKPDPRNYLGLGIPQHGYASDLAKWQESQSKVIEKLLFIIKVK